MQTVRIRAHAVAILVGAACSCPLAVAQNQSVNPGINKSFENPDVTNYVGTFEREGRDVFDRRNEIVKACGLKPGMAVADIGAGTGLFTRMFANVVGPTGRVYAVDIAENFVRHIEESAKRDGLANVVGVVCTGDSVKLPADSVNMAFICDVYHHFEFPQRTLHSIHLALKPGGTLVLIDFQRIPGVSSDFILSHVRGGQEVFAQEVIDAGFRQVEEQKELLRESYFLRFEKVAKPASAN